MLNDIPSVVPLPAAHSPSPLAASEFSHSCIHSTSITIKIRFSFHSHFNHISIISIPFILTQYDIVFIYGNIRNIYIFPIRGSFSRISTIASSSDNAIEMNISLTYDGY